MTRIEGYRKLPWTSITLQGQQDLDPVYITTLRAPADGGQQAIVMPTTVYVSDDDPWFGPFFTLNDPDRSVSIDILHQYGFVSAVPGLKNPDRDLCSLPGYADSSLAIGYQTAATQGFYVRRCPGFEHLTYIELEVTTYPDAEVYTTHRISVNPKRTPSPTRLPSTATPTASSTAKVTVTPTAFPTATPTSTLLANEITLTTPTATPTATSASVPSLTALSGENAVELSWTSVAGAELYELWVWTVANDWQKIGGDNLTGTVYNHTGLVAGTTYHYAIRARFAGGDFSSWSEHVSATVGVSQSSVAAPTLTAAASGVDIVSLNWGAVTDAVRYELYVWTSDGWQQIGGDNLTGTAYIHAGLTAGATYYYSVRALLAGGGASPWSEFVPATLAALPTATATASTTSTPTPSSTPIASATPTSVPLPVPALSAQATVNGVEISWSTVTGATRYELWVWDSVSGWSQIGGNSLTGTTFTLTDVDAGTTYWYAIRAVNAEGETSVWSPNVEATVPSS